MKLTRHIKNEQGLWGTTFFQTKREHFAGCPEESVNYFVAIPISDKSLPVMRDFFYFMKECENRNMHLQIRALPDNGGVRSVKKWAAGRGGNVIEVGGVKDHLKHDDRILQSSVTINRPMIQNFIVPEEYRVAFYVFCNMWNTINRIYSGQARHKYKLVIDQEEIRSLNEMMGSNYGKQCRAYFSKSQPNGYYDPCGADCRKPKVWGDVRMLMLKSTYDELQKIKEGA
jgi:hypothetical protein